MFEDNSLILSINSFVKLIVHLLSCVNNNSNEAVIYNKLNFWNKFFIPLTENSS